MELLSAGDSGVPVEKVLKGLPKDFVTTLGRCHYLPKSVLPAVFGSLPLGSRSLAAAHGLIRQEEGLWVVTPRGDQFIEAAAALLEMNDPLWVEKLETPFETEVQTRNFLERLDELHPPPAP